MRRQFLVFFITAFVLASAAQGQSISASEAGKHIGEKAIVCGFVASAHYDSRSGATFLNLDKAYPNQIFTIFVARKDRDNVGAIEKEFLSKQICVSGKISTYKDTPEIIVNDKKQLTTKGSGKT